MSKKRTDRAASRTRAGEAAAAPAASHGTAGARLLVGALTLVALAAAGAISSLGWAPYDIAPLMVVGPAAALALSRGRGRGRRFFVGWWVGAFLYGTAFHWVYEVARDMSGMGPAVCALAVALYGAWHGLFWGLFTLLADSARRTIGVAWIAVVPALWALLEWGFPFLFPIFVGNALWKVEALAQIADLTGIYGPSALIVAVAAACAEAWARWRGAASGSAGEGGPGGATAPAWKPLVAVVAFLLAVATYGWIRSGQIAASAPSATLRVALVQPVPTLAEKNSNHSPTRYQMLARALNLSRGLLPRAGEFDAVIWPEGGFPFRMPDWATVGTRRPATWRDRGAREVLALADALGADMVTGGLRRHEGRTRNSAALFPREGAPRLYDKRELVPFGEYLPLSDTFPSLKGKVPGVADHARGEAFAHFPLAGHPALVTICYEAILPGFVRNGLAETDELILNLTNDVWFGATRALDLHLMAQVARTVENRVPLVRATTTGISAVADERGRILAQTEKMAETVLEHELELRPVWSFYRAAGDVFLWLYAALAAAWVSFCVWRRRRGTSSAPGCPNERTGGVGSHGRDDG